MANPNDPNYTPAAATDRGDVNPDPITGEPGAHPIGTGIGAASGAATGAAMGLAGGPVGAIIGGIAGAVTGGLIGKGVEELVDPTVEDAYWRDNHARQPYAAGSTYDDYAGAYRTGYTAAGTHAGRSFDEVEPTLRDDYERTKDAAAHGWDKAKDATRAAFDRAATGIKATGRDIKRAVN